MLCPEKLCLILIQTSFVIDLQVIHDEQCHNLSLGLVTRARACKLASQEKSSKIRPYALENARECEGIDPHTPKGTPTLGVGVSVDSRMFKEQFQGLKPNGLKKSLYHWKAIET
jgi:hypothetical protein